MNKIICLFFITIAACLQISAEETQKPNVVVIVIDTLRADHLPFYGYNSNTAPFMSKLIEDSTLYHYALSTSSWTAPATASIHTSLYPSQHGVQMGLNSTSRMVKENPKFPVNKLPKNHLTIAEVFKANNYTTVAATDNANIAEKIGFDRGYDYFQNYRNKGADIINAKIDEWIPKIKEAGKPYFMYLQYMDPHQPYSKRSPWFEDFQKNNPDRNAKINAYDSEIARTDKYIQELYKRLSWDKNTVIIVTSDHGEEFGEHGQFGHGKNLFVESTRVPLFFYKKGSKKRVVKETVSVIDIFPTILSLLNIDPIKNHEGIDLKPFEDHTPPKRPLISQIWKRQPGNREVEAYAILENDLKYTTKTITNEKAESEEYLYNYEKDLFEKNNILKNSATEKANLVSSYKKFDDDLKKFK